MITESRENTKNIRNQETDIKNSTWERPFWKKWLNLKKREWILYDTSEKSKLWHQPNGSENPTSGAPPQAVVIGGFDSICIGNCKPLIFIHIKRKKEKSMVHIILYKQLIFH